MAQQALGAGTSVPRRRALFGLLDADGWALGVGQGLRLADHHHLHPRLPARSSLLPDGRADGRPRRARLVADQPLPARERDPALPGPGRCARAVAAVAARARPAAARTDGAVLQVGTQGPVHRRLRRDDRADDGLRRAHRGHRATSTSGLSGPDLPAPRADASVAYVAGSIYLIGGDRRDRRTDHHGLHADARQRDRRPRGVEGRRTRWPCRRPAAEPPPRSPPTASC